MTNPAPPTQASSRTVTSIAIPFLRVVLDLEPTFERDKHDELMYPFGEAGHRARNFYGDPYVLGPYAPPVSGAPANTAIPVISQGLPPVVGITLKVPTGVWTGSPTEFVYRWFRNGVPIIGAASKFYVPTVGDAGAMLSAGVEGVNSIGAGAEAVSAAVGPVHTTSGGL